MATLTPEKAREALILAIGAGATVKDACAQAQRSTKWYDNLRATDADFKKAVDDARARASKAKDGSKDPTLYQLTFAEWRMRFLGRHTYPHMSNLIDVMEG